MSIGSGESAILAAPLRPAEAPTPPVAPARPGIWGALAWLVVLLLVALVVPDVIGTLLALSTGLHPTQIVEPALFAGQMAGAGLAVVLLWRRLGRGWVAELGLNRLPLVPALLAVLCVPGLQFVCGGVSLLLGMLFGQDEALTMVKDAASTLPWWLCLLSVAVGPAVNEELWFRGFLGRGLVGRYGPTVGVLLTSLLFGAFHLSLVQGAYAAVMGLGLHLIYRATRSLWVPILVHGLFNAAALTGALADAPRPDELGPTGLAVVLPLGGLAVAVLAAAGWALYRLRVREEGPAR